MMKHVYTILLLLIGFALTGRIATAQPIHGNPFKAAYAGPIEYPKDGGQCHWARKGVNAFFSAPMTDAELAAALKDNTKAAHVHVDLISPRDAEVGAPFTVQFIITAFHLAGQIGQFNPIAYMEDLEPAVREHMAGNVIWDATGTTTAPLMIGDPSGVRTWSGHFTVTPAAYGYFSISGAASASFANGDAMNTFAIVPFYSTVDPSQRERQIEGGDVVAACAASSADDPVTQWAGAVKARSLYPLPDVPFSRWVVNYISTLYGSNGIPESQASFEQLRDLDLHNGVKGVSVPLITTELNESGAFFSVLWDVNTLGSTGSHKTATIRHQTSGLARMSTLLVETVTVDPAAPGNDTPVPALVTPPTPATPPPPPLPSWENVPVAFQRFGSESRFRLCVGVNCFELVIK